MDYIFYKKAYHVKYRFTQDRLYLVLTVDSLYFLESCNLNLLVTNIYSYLILKKVYSTLPDIGKIEGDFLDTINTLCKVKGLEYIKSEEYELYFTLIVENVDASLEDKPSDNWLDIRYSTIKNVVVSNPVFVTNLGETVLGTLKPHFFLVFKNSKINDLHLDFPRTGFQSNLILINSDVKLNNYRSNCKITLVKSSIVTVSSKLLLVPCNAKDDDLTLIYLVNERFKSESDDTMYYKENKEKDYRLYYESKHFIYCKYSVDVDNLDCRFSEYDTGVYVNMDKDSSILHCNEDFEIAAFFSGADYRSLRSPIMCELVEHSVVEIESTKQYIEFKKVGEYLNVYKFY